jgi:hypothetical protein
MSTEPSKTTEPSPSLERPVEELLQRAQPLPPHDQMIVDGLTDYEEAAFLSALNLT